MIFNLKRNINGRFEIRSFNRKNKSIVILHNNGYFDNVTVEEELMQKFSKIMDHSGIIIKERFDIEILLKSYVMMDREYADNEGGIIEYKCQKYEDKIRKNNLISYKRSIMRILKENENEKKGIEYQILRWIFDLELWDLKGNEYRWMVYKKDKNDKKIND